MAEPIYDDERPTPARMESGKPRRDPMSIFLRAASDPGMEADLRNSALDNATVARKHDSSETAVRRWRERTILREHPYDELSVTLTRREWHAITRAFREPSKRQRELVLPSTIDRLEEAWRLLGQGK
jgi:hypothetical protein